MLLAANSNFIVISPSGNELKIASKISTMKFEIISITPQ